MNRALDPKRAYITCEGCGIASFGGENPRSFFWQPRLARVFVCHFGLNEPRAIPFDGQLGG